MMRTFAKNKCEMYSLQKNRYTFDYDIIFYVDEDSDACSGTKAMPIRHSVFTIHLRNGWSQKQYCHVFRTCPEIVFIIN